MRLECVCVCVYLDIGSKLGTQTLYNFIEVIYLCISYILIETTHLKFNTRKFYGGKNMHSYYYV